MLDDAYLRIKKKNQIKDYFMIKLNYFHFSLSLIKLYLPMISIYNCKSNRDKR